MYIVSCQLGLCGMFVMVPVNTRDFGLDKKPGREFLLEPKGF